MTLWGESHTHSYMYTHTRALAPLTCCACAVSDLCSPSKPWHLAGHRHQLQLLPQCPKHLHSPLTPTDPPSLASRPWPPRLALLVLARRLLGPSCMPQVHQHQHHRDPRVALAQVQGLVAHRLQCAKQQQLLHEKGRRRFKWRWVTQDSPQRLHLATPCSPQALA